MPLGVPRTDQRVRDLRKESRDISTWGLWGAGHTAETLFARKGISRDVRAQIQSHGLSGVQARHNDKHDYRDEKRRALENPGQPSCVASAAQK